jgi:hypothetical protein
MRPWHLHLAAALLSVAGWHGVAEACSLAFLPPHELDAAEMAADSSPPSPVVVDAVEILRGQGSQGDGCGAASTSCDDIGRVLFHFTTPTDDRTGAALLGYRIVLVSGELPEGLQLPLMPVRRFQEGDPIFLHWVDGATDDQEPVDFVVAVSTVDLAGNESAPVEVHVLDAGSGGGCRIGALRGAHVRAPALWLAAFAAVALATRRRHRRRQP